MGLFFIEFGAEPRPTSVWYDRERSAFRAMGEFDAAALEGARWAVVSGVTPALGAQGRSATERFAALAREAGAALLVDVNYRARLWAGDEARDVLEPLVAQAHVVICSRADAQIVFGIRADDPIEVLDDLRGRHASSADVVVLTLGSEGAVASERDGEPVMQQAFASAAVDRIGSGDAFVAGLVWGLSEGAALATGLARGAALAALKRTVAGDLARFTRDEVLAVVADPQKVLLR
jgi:2-dehydro-3-deoxygluconokinase